MGTRWRKNPGKAEVAQLQLISSGVHQEILRLDVTVHYPVVVTPVNRSAKLLNVPGPRSTCNIRMSGDSKRRRPFRL